MNPYGYYDPVKSHIKFMRYMEAQADIAKKKEEEKKKKDSSKALFPGLTKGELACIVAICSPFIANGLALMLLINIYIFKFLGVLITSAVH